MEENQLDHRPGFQFSLRTLLLFATIAPLVIFACIPLHQVAVWDGRYNLMIDVHADPSVDSGSLKFAIYWNPEHAALAVNAAPDNHEVTLDFEPAEAIAGNRYLISVNVSGKSGTFVDTYTQPKCLVIEYYVRGANDKPHRKSFDLEQIRGNRTMVVELP